MAWDVKCDEFGMRASLHAGNDTEVKVTGYPQNVGGNGNPSFVHLQVNEGDYPGISSIGLYLTPQQADELLVKLTHAVQVAYGQPIDGDE